MPVFAALVGVLGGVGGAIVGGVLANSGQEEAFLRERKAHEKDLRLATYSTYVSAVDAFIGKVSVAENRFDFTDSSDTNRDAINDFINEEASEVLEAAAAVELLADTDVRSAALTLRDRITNIQGVPPGALWRKLRLDFIEQARIEVEANAESRYRATESASRAVTALI